LPTHASSSLPSIAIGTPAPSGEKASNFEGPQARSRSGHGQSLTSDEAVAVGATAAAEQQHLWGPAPPHAARVEPHAARIHATSPFCPPMHFPSSRTQPKRRKEKKTILEPVHAPARSGARAQTLHRRLGLRSNRGHRGGWTGLEAGGREELMAEEAGAPKLARKRLHGV
jgi:hypothetical protein